MSVPYSAGKMASQIDVHVAKRHIYWCDHGNKDSVGGGLHRVGTDGAGYQRIISSGIGVKGIRGLAVDWIAGILSVISIEYTRAGANNAGPDQTAV